MQRHLQARRTIASKERTDSRGLLSVKKRCYSMATASVYEAKRREMDQERRRSWLREAGQVKERVMGRGEGGGLGGEPVRETARTTTSVSCSSALNKAGRMKKRRRRELVNHCLPWRRKGTVGGGVAGGAGSEGERSKASSASGALSAF